MNAQEILNTLKTMKQQANVVVVWATDEEKLRQLAEQVKSLRMELLKQLEEHKTPAPPPADDNEHPYWLLSDAVGQLDELRDVLEDENEPYDTCWVQDQLEFVSYCVERANFSEEDSK